MQFDEAERVGLLVSEAVGAAPTLTVAVARLGGRLRDLLHLSRISLRRVDLLTGEAVIEAMWSETPTRVGIGTTMALAATSVPEILGAHGPVLGEVDDSLLESLLSREGVRSWATIPLWREWSVGAVLSLSSWRPNRFTSGDCPLLSELGRTVERRLLGLLDAHVAERCPPHLGRVSA